MVDAYGRSPLTIRLIASVSTVMRLYLCGLSATRPRDKQIFAVAAARLRHVAGSEWSAKSICR